MNLSSVEVEAEWVAVLAETTQVLLLRRDTVLSADGSSEAQDRKTNEAIVACSRTLVDKH